MSLDELPSQIQKAIVGHERCLIMTITCPCEQCLAFCCSDHKKVISVIPWGTNRWCNHVIELWEVGEIMDTWIDRVEGRIVGQVEVVAKLA